MIFKNILVPYDGTPSSQMAFNSALKLAKKHEAKIVIFTCIPDQAIFGFFKTKSNKLVLEQEKHRAEKQISHLKECATKIGVPLASKIITSFSLPASCIVRYADEHEVDLIVMSRSRLKWAEKMLYFSTVENVFRHTKRSILVVK